MRRQSAAARQRARDAAADAICPQWQVKIPRDGLQAFRPVSNAHGSNSTYTNKGCRCLSCTAAHREHVKREKKNRTTESEACA